MKKQANEFFEGVKAKLKSRSTIYAMLFLLLLIVQAIYQSYQAEGEKPAPVSEQGDQ